MTEKDQELQEEQPTSSFPNIISDVFTSLLQIAQKNIIKQIQETVHSTLDQVKETTNEVIRKAITSLIFTLLTLIGFIFAIVGLSLWLGELSGLGNWFGFLIIGIIIIIIALIGALVQKNND